MTRAEDYICTRGLDRSLAGWIGFVSWLQAARDGGGDAVRFVQEYRMAGEICRQP